MVEFADRIYSLASEALAEQERQVAEVRSRGAALLAAGAVIPSLLAHAVFHGHHPHGRAEVSATVLGVLGAVVLLFAVVLLLRPLELGFSLKARETYRALWEQGVVEQPMLDLVLADALQDRREANAAAVQTLIRWLTLSLAALILEAAGFATAAALAS